MIRALRCRCRTCCGAPLWPDMEGRRKSGTQANGVMLRVGYLGGHCCCMWPRWNGASQSVRWWRGRKGESRANKNLRLPISTKLHFGAFVNTIRAVFKLPMVKQDLLLHQHPSQRVADGVSFVNNTISCRRLGPAFQLEGVRTIGERESSDGLPVLSWPFLLQFR